MEDKNDSFDLEIEEVEDTPYVQYDITSYPSDLTLSGLDKMYQDGDIIIPQFQRNFVWSIQQASLLIDSFLAGLPVPPLFFYISDDNKSLVIDGQQRILSIVFFFEEYFGKEDLQKRRQVFRLQLGDKHPYNGKKFSELSDSDQRKLTNLSVLRAINIRQMHPTEESTSAYHIFERLNTGGTPLKSQEIRNCVFRGPFTEILKKINYDENWRKIIGKPYPDKHQRDVELLLRVFSLAAGAARYEKPMKEFLNISMRTHVGGDTNRVISFIQSFQLATKLIVEKLGEKPFHIRGPLNTSVLDSVLCTTTQHINVIPNDYRGRFQSLIKDNDFTDLTTLATTDTKILKARFEKAKEILIG